MVAAELEPAKIGFAGRRLAAFAFRREITFLDMEARVGFEPTNDGFADPRSAVGKESFLSVLSQPSEVYVRWNQQNGVSPFDLPLSCLRVFHSLSRILFFDHAGIILEPAIDRIWVAV